MSKFQRTISDDIDKQGIYPVLEDVLISIEENSSYMPGSNKETNAKWAAEVFDAMLCAFDLDYEKASAADRIAAASLAIRNLERLIKAENENK